MKKYSIFTEKDFDIFAPSGFTKVSESGTIPAGTYSFNPLIEFFHINDGSNATKGTVVLPLGFVKIGDFIKVNAETLSRSGDKPSLKLTYNISSPLSSSSEVVRLQSTSTETFENLSFNYLSERNAYYFLEVGLSAEQIGEFYIRNIYSQVDSNYAATKKYKQGFRTYAVLGNSGSYTVQSNFSSDNATLTIDSVAKEINLNHSIPFATKAGVAFEGTNSAGVSNDYEVRTQSHTALGCKIKIYDKLTNTLQDPATISGALWFQLLFSGLDNVIESY